MNLLKIENKIKLHSSSLRNEVSFSPSASSPIVTDLLVVVSRAVVAFVAACLRCCRKYLFGSQVESGLEVCVAT